MASKMQRRKRIHRSESKNSQANFAEHCVDCEHYHDGGTCCFCGKEYTMLKKTREQHLAEIEDPEHEIDIS